MATSTALPFIEKAAPLIKLGIPVIPLVPNEKFPPSSMNGWQKERKYSTDPAQIAAWNEENPDYNVALVAMGEEDGFCFLEFDGKPGLKKICEQHGKEFPNTRIHRSGRGGGHYIFKHTGKSLTLGNRSASVAKQEWFSFRADRKFVVGAGSIHPNGRMYEVVRDVEPIEIPDWLVDFIAEHTAAERKFKKGEAAPVRDDFDFDDWCDFYSNIFTIPNAHCEGWMATDGCPWCGYRHEQSVLTGFYYDGEYLGFHCFAAGCPGYGKGIGETIKMMNEQLGQPYPYLIWPENETNWITVDDIVEEEQKPEPEGKELTLENFLETIPSPVNPLELKAAPKPNLVEKATPKSLLGFPDNCLYGVLGEMAYAMQMPRGMAYPALITCFSAIPINDEMDGCRINVNTIIMAGVGVGKNTAWNRAAQILGLAKGVDYEKATPASDRGVGTLLGDKLVGGKKSKERVPGPKKMLLICDEFMEVLKKAKIENSGLFQTLQCLFDDNRKVFSDKMGKQTVDCRLSIGGSIPVSEKNAQVFSELFGKDSTHGMLSRFLLGYFGGRWNYRKWTCPTIPIGRPVTKTKVVLADDDEFMDIPTDSWQPAPLVKGMTPEATAMFDAWEDPTDESGRSKFYVAKVAYLTASANGDEYVGIECITAAMKFMEWQAKLREVFKPGVAENNIDAKATERILTTLQRKWDAGEDMDKDGYLQWRRVSHDAKWAKIFGSTCVVRVINGLIDCGELAPKMTEDENGKEKVDKRYVKVVGKPSPMGKKVPPENEPN